MLHIRFICLLALFGVCAGLMESGQASASPAPYPVDPSSVPNPIRSWPVPYPTGTPMSPFLAIGDVGVYQGNVKYDIDKNIKDRLKIFQQAGNGLLLVGYKAYEPITNAQALNYMSIASKMKFMFKLSVGYNNYFPADFFQNNPTAAFQDGNNDGFGENIHAISYWYPELPSLLEHYDDQAFAQLKQQGLLDSVAYVLIPIGPEGEPLYPTSSTTGDRDEPMMFWWYDTNAVASFQKNERDKYGTIIVANKALGTSYKTFSDIIPPEIGTGTPALWFDALMWYRDSKRAFISWQVQHYNRLLAKYYPDGNGPKLEIYVAGDETLKGDYENAVVSLGKNTSKALFGMSDWEYLCDIAAANNIVLVYDAMPNLQKGAHLLSMINSYGDHKIEFWGQDSGGNYNSFTNAYWDEVANETMALGMAGFEFISSKTILATDPKTGEISTIDPYIDYKARNLWLEKIWAGEDADPPLQLRLDMNQENFLDQGECIFASTDHSWKLCVDGQTGNLSYAHDNVTVWSTGLDTPCLNTTCNVVHDSEGYLSLKDQQNNQYLWRMKPWINTSATYLKFSPSTNSLLFVTDVNDEVLWSSTSTLPPPHPLPPVSLVSPPHITQ